MALERIGIIGAGQMGSGISQAIAQSGITVLLSDVDIALAEKAKAGIDKALARPYLPLWAVKDWLA